MSCPEKNRDVNKKPPRTEDMKERGLEYVWRSVKDNPNLYCWIPTDKYVVNTLREGDINIQDIPEPIEPLGDDEIEKIAKEADRQKQKTLLKKYKNNTKILNKISVDDNKKYDIVKKFIIDNNLKIYGGTAINMYLKDEHKLYDRFSPPDYDIYSPDPWKDSVKLANIFHKEGFRMVEVRTGVHKGTYKVFVELWHVADITFVEKSSFEKIPTRKFNGINVSSPLVLQTNFYKELSEVSGQPERWPKVFKRQKYLESDTKIFRKNISCKFMEGEEISEDRLKLLNRIYGYAKLHKLIFSGDFAYNIYITIGGGKKYVPVHSYTILCENAESVVKDIYDHLIKLDKNLDTLVQYFPGKDINNSIYTIFYEKDGVKYLLAQVMDLTTCTPYKTLLGERVASIDYIKYELFYASVFEDKEESKFAQCKIKYLENIQYKYYSDMGITETDDSPFQRLVIKCKGPVQNVLKESILKKYMNRSKIYKTKYKGGYVIKVIERKKTSKGCKGRKEDQCNYPCAWSNKCIDAPNKYMPRKESVYYK